MNVYHKLLGIPPAEQPPNLYRLLAIDLFESDEEVITNAARGRCQFLRGISLKQPDVTEPLLNEIMAAKVRLLDPVERSAYDQELRERLAGVPEAAPAVVADRSDDADASSRRSAPPLAADSEADSAISSESWMLAPAPEPDDASDGEWIIGSGSAASIRVRGPWVSRRHCRVWRSEGKTFVEDLGSKNGTFINDVRLDSAMRVRGDDIVSLGRKTWLPWPLPPACEGRDMRVYSIGRSPDCDYVLTDKSVSQHHAQLIVERNVVILQDLRSLNGTRVGTLDNRIQQCELPGHLSVFFGAAKVFAQDLIGQVRDR